MLTDWVLRWPNANYSNAILFIKDSKFEVKYEVVCSSTNSYLNFLSVITTFVIQTYQEKNLNVPMNVFILMKTFYQNFQQSFEHQMQTFDKYNSQEIEPYRDEIQNYIDRFKTMKAFW